MKTIDSTYFGYKELNDEIRNTDGDCKLTACLGQRCIAAGMSNKKIIIEGIAGNALGAYLNGAEITVRANAQDAVGDTMNEGKIVIHGNIGDAAGYAMRGGKIFVRGNAGYRAGIHMKEYKEKKPIIVIGGNCGSFLGEYQGGGIIIVLGLNNDDNHKIVGNFPCTGMHGGKLFLRSSYKSCESIRFPGNVTVTPATPEDLKEIDEYLAEFCHEFEYRKEEVLNAPFTMIAPDSKNPYQQMYVTN